MVNPPTYIKGNSRVINVVNDNTTTPSTVGNVRSIDDVCEKTTNFINTLKSLICPYTSICPERT